MTAKPQPMAGQPDAADDLIAELAKLMAQDAQGSEKPVAEPSFSVRIPGGDTTPPVTPGPRFDFGRSPAESTDESDEPVAPEVTQPEAAAPEVSPPVMAEPAATAPVVPAVRESEPEPEPFHFDFGLGAKPSFATSTVPTAAPIPAAPTTTEAPADFDHDSIADLIAAELSAESSMTPPLAPKPETVEPRPAPRASWTPPAVSADSSDEDSVPPPRAPSFHVTPPNERRVEPDRFKVPPVFGLAPKPALGETPAPTTSPVATPPQPATPLDADDSLGRDPIDEIENLIGRAMRVEFDAPAEPVAEARPAPSPALRSLATPFAATQSSQADTRGLTGADEAILAAAQATGAEIGWVDGPEVDEPEPDAVPRRRAPRRLGMSRAVAGPAVAVVLLLAAGLGLYWVLGMGKDSGPAPLLTADTSPSKQTPPPQPDNSSAQQSVVFNEIDGVVPGAEEQLVSRDQADVNEVAQIPPTASVSEEGLANRKVRTVTVRPDGTIVSGDDSVAGSTILPVARPNVPEVPGAETASPELLASTEPAAVPTPTPTPTPAPAAAAIVTPVIPGSTVPAVDLAGAPLAGRTAPVPMLRPAGLAALAASTPPTPVTAMVDTPVSSGNTLPPPPGGSLLPTATPAPSTAAVPQGGVEVDALPNNAPAYVQLASQRSEAEARASAQAMVTRFGPLFGGANMEVQRVDLGEKGIYYRVRVPANSLQDANSICTNVKAAGGDCFTM